MGRMCDWCGAVIRGVGVAVSHGLCGGCFEEMRAALSSKGMRVEDPRLKRGD